MIRFPATIVRAAAIAIPAMFATSIAIPARAQVGVSISFNDFHSRLAPYGTWSNNPRWGQVWRPSRVASGFRPYYEGHWEDTREYGWLWVSDETWGDIPYHYGRWVSDPREGWLWVPGYVWGPSWVVWRSGEGNIGWFPMPPDDGYYGDGAYRGNFDNQYGYRDWYGPSFGAAQFLSLWIFVGEDHFRDHNFRRYAVPERNVGGFIGRTRDTTNYVTINNYVVNRSVDSERLQQDTKQRFQPVAAANVIGRNALVTQATAGRQVEQREHQQHPIPVNINPAEQRGRVDTNSPAQQPNVNQTPQNPKGRGANPNNAPQSNQPTERGAPVANTQEPKNNTAPRDQTGGRNRDQTAPVAPRIPAANNDRQTNPPTGLETQSIQSPPVRGIPDQNAKAIVRDTQAPARVQENTPVGGSAEGQGNARNNQSRGTKQSDSKDGGDQKPADEKKNGGADRRQN